MAKRWALWGLFAVLSVAALISSLGTAFQTLPLNPGKRLGNPPSQTS
ncbi:hypothetical protein [Acidithiobacillus ferrivorans]|uniref:Uncharacterized protein n=1 Tax=Acidithiobacillus ferrivorans TaxID=160808 RepID=A0A7T4WCC3_9PROT|nr:hypothetical protein [Acidithiobacillus ferrivorans]QQD72006.1 hypothetical protein H2515_11290 [Acidithiobacillus ferrivorans]